MPPEAASWQRYLCGSAARGSGFYGRQYPSRLSLPTTLPSVAGVSRKARTVGSVSPRAGCLGLIYLVPGSTQGYGREVMRVPSQFATACGSALSLQDGVLRCSPPSSTYAPSFPVDPVTGRIAPFPC